MQRQQKPLPWLSGISEPILNGQVQLSRTKEFVKNTLKLGAVQVVQLVSSHDFHISQHISGVFVCASDSRLDLTVSHTNLVNQFTVFGDKRMIRLAAQYKNGARPFGGGGCREGRCGGC